MKTFRLAAMFIMLASLISCERFMNIIEDPPEEPILPEFTFGENFELPYLHTARNADNHLTITFSDVAEDSRCPTGAQCVWAGNARLKFVFKKELNLYDIELNTHPDFPQDTTLAGYHIALIDVQPYPHIDSTFTKIDYKAELLIAEE